MNQPQMVECWSCQGRGNFLGAAPDRGNPECTVCNGTGKINEQERYKDRAIRILYCNHEEQIAWRNIIPIKLEYRNSPPWHPEPMWILHAYDLDKRDVRDFAFLNIYNIV